MERIDARIDEKLERWGDKLRNDLFAKLKTALDHVNLRLSNLQQSRTNPVEAVIAKPALEVVEVIPFEKTPKEGSDTLVVDLMAKTIAVLFKKTDGGDVILIR